MPFGDGANAVQLIADFIVAAFDLDDQQAFTHWITGFGKGLGRFDAGAVHELDRDGQNARVNDVTDALAGDLVAVIANQNRQRALGFGLNAQGCLGDDAQLPFRAADHAEQVQTSGIHMRPAHVNDCAVHQHHFDAKQVVGGHTVFQAMRPARIHRDIASDRTGKLG